MCNKTKNPELYAKLRGKIKEVFGTQEAFAAAMELDPSSISMRLNGWREWTRLDIERACVCLHIPFTDAHEYFF